MRSSRSRRAGFSLIELLIVVAIIMCISAVTIPNVLHAAASLRCRLTMTSLSGMIQQARSYAIKNNKVMTVHYVMVSGQWVAYIEDASQPAALSSAMNKKQMYLGKLVTKYDTPSGTNAPPALTPTAMWGSGTSATIAAGELSFNSRGLPCLYDTTSGSCAMNDGFVYYFSYAPPFGQNGWTAISVSPAGRVKTWLASGAAWMTN